MKPAPALARDTLEAIVAEVRAVYAELDARPAERACANRAECCRFRLTGRTPQPTLGEALVAALGWRAAGRKSPPPVESNAKDGACPFLDPATARCAIYRDRPFGCRTHFCEAAGGVRARGEIVDLIRRLERIDEIHRGGGPRPIVSAVRAVWDRLPARSGRQKR